MSGSWFARDARTRSERSAMWPETWRPNNTTVGQSWRGSRGSVAPMRGGRLQRRALRAGSRRPSGIARLHALLEKLPLHAVARQGERRPEVPARRLAPAPAQLQLTERRMVERIGVEPLAIGDRGDLLEPARGAVALRDGDRPIERDDRGRPQDQERAVQCHDLRP